MSVQDATDSYSSFAIVFIGEQNSLKSLGQLFSVKSSLNKNEYGILCKWSLPKVLSNQAK